MKDDADVGKWVAVEVSHYRLNHQIKSYKMSVDWRVWEDNFDSIDKKSAWATDGDGLYDEPNRNAKQALNFRRKKESSSENERARCRQPSSLESRILHTRLASRLQHWRHLVKFLSYFFFYFWGEGKFSVLVGFFTTMKKREENCKRNEQQRQRGIDLLAQNSLHNHYLGPTRPSSSRVKMLCMRRFQISRGAEKIEEMKLSDYEYRKWKLFHKSSSKWILCESERNFLYHN